MGLFPGCRLTAWFQNGKNQSGALACFLFDPGVMKDVPLYVLTAAHVVNMAESVLSSVKYDTSMALTGKVYTVPASGGVDAALIDVTNQKSNLTANSFKIGGGGRDVDANVANVTSANVNGPISAYSCANGQELSGTISGFNGLEITTNVATLPSDSGGPYYFIDQSGSAELCGMLSFGGQSRQGTSVAITLSGIIKQISEKVTLHQKYVTLQLATWSNQQLWSA